MSHQSDWICYKQPINFLFLIAIDWAMRTATAQARNGVQWTPWLQLDDLDFADDLALLSHTHRQMKEKTTGVKDSSAQIGLHINREKTKVLKINTTITEPVRLDDDLLEEVKSFAYLGSVVDTQGGNRWAFCLRMREMSRIFCVRRHLPFLNALRRVFKRVI